MFGALALVFVNISKNNTKVNFAAEESASGNDNIRRLDHYTVFYVTINISSYRKMLTKGNSTDSAMRLLFPERGIRRNYQELRNAAL
jgi:hypothetical protein